MGQGFHLAPLHSASWPHIETPFIHKDERGHLSRYHPVWRAAPCGFCLPTR